jgi:hypothetical protein
VRGWAGEREGPAVVEWAARPASGVEQFEVREFRATAARPESFARQLLETARKMPEPGFPHLEQVKVEVERLARLDAAPVKVVCPENERTGPIRQT